MGGVWRTSWGNHLSILGPFSPDFWPWTVFIFSAIRFPFSAFGPFPFYAWLAFLPFFFSPQRFFLWSKRSRSLSRKTSSDKPENASQRCISENGGGGESTAMCNAHVHELCDVVHKASVPEKLQSLDRKPEDPELSGTQFDKMTTRWGLSLRVLVLKCPQLPSPVIVLRRRFSFWQKELKGHTCAQLQTIVYELQRVALSPHLDSPQWISGSSFHCLCPFWQGVSVCI